MKVFHLLFLVCPLFFNLTSVLQFQVLISCISQNVIHQPPKDGCELVAFREGERQRSSGNNGVITMRVPIEVVLQSGPLVLVSVSLLSCIVHAYKILLLFDTTRSKHKYLQLIYWSSPTRLHYICARRIMTWCHMFHRMVDFWSIDHQKFIFTLSLL